MEYVLKKLLSLWGWQKVMLKVWGYVKPELEKLADKTDTQIDDGLVQFLDEIIVSLADKGDVKA